MQNNRSMPSSVVIPVLHYADVASAAEWLCATFGFKRRLIIGDHHRVQLDVPGGGHVVIAEFPGGVEYSGLLDGHSTMLRVENVEDHFRRVSKTDAKVLNEPLEWPYGEKQYSVEDPGGHVWTFSESVEDVDPLEWGGVIPPDSN